MRLVSSSPLATTDAQGEVCENAGAGRKTCLDEVDRKGTVRRSDGSWEPRRATTSPCLGKLPCAYDACEWTRGLAHTRDLDRRLDGPRLSPPLIPLPQRHLLSHPFLRSRSSARHAPFSWTPFSGFNPRVFVRRNRDVHPFKFSRSPFDFSPVFSFQSISFRSDHSFLLVGGLVPFERGEVEGLCRDPHVDRVDVTEPHSRRRGRFTTRAERGRPWRRAK